MAACGLQQIFDKPLPDNPTLIETHSWNHHIKSMTSLDRSSFTEIFGQLHFKESSHSSSSSSPDSSSSKSSSASLADLNSHSEPENSSKKYGTESKKSIPSSSPFPRNNPYKGCHRSSDSFSSMNSESLQLCTEGLGFESSFDVEDLKNEMKIVPQERHSNKKEKAMNHSCDIRRSRTRVGSIFPPPISCIGKSGKPGVCFKSFRQNGRFVLKEVRVPTQEFLQAFREDGRLKLQFIQPEDDIPEYEDEETDDMDDDEFTEEDEDYEGGGENEEDKEDIGS